MTGKSANPVGVAVLAVVTLGIYLVCWWYCIDRELADFGRVKGTSELGDAQAAESGLTFG